MQMKIGEIVFEGTSEEVFSTYTRIQQRITPTIKKDERKKSSVEASLEKAADLYCSEDQPPATRCLHACSLNSTYLGKLIKTLKSRGVTYQKRRRSKSEIDKIAKDNAAMQKWNKPDPEPCDEDVEFERKLREGK